MRASLPFSLGSTTLVDSEDRTGQFHQLSGSYTTLYDHFLSLFALLEYSGMNAFKLNTYGKQRRARGSETADWLTCLITV